MKKRVKLLAVVLCLLLFATMALGSGSSGSGEDKKISDVSSGASSTEETSTENVTTEIAIEEQVLYDENDIKITATGLEDSWLGTELQVLIENNSSQSITIQARNANVNGYMVPTVMSADVAAGKKANDSLTFETSGLKECGIDNIATMEFLFHIFDSESWDEIVDTDVITVETSIAESYTQTYDDSGEVLVDTDGIKIVGKGLSDEDSFWGPGVILYIENNSDQNVTIQVRDVSVNGFMVDSSMSEDVVAGKKAMSAVQFFSTDLEENSIDDITDVELYFHIFNLESWDTIFDSDVISISF
ncbi:MAG: hypothetical protein PUE81_04450 [Lachnospiraceae bacterium]|nr:hypothetical protein [Lachnospiraceae bacterium]